MAKVKYISTQAEIPPGENFVLVLYGEEYAQTRHRSLHGNFHFGYQIFDIGTFSLSG
jgi:hypothetical protein